MNLTNMSRDERSLLLYFETCAVDLGGRVDTLRMNDIDHEITARWVEEEFIEYGRIRVADHNRQGSMWVKLSDVAWVLAHQERRARADRMWENRFFKTTAENREAA